MIQRRGSVFHNPARVYGARDGDGELVHMPNPEDREVETVPTFKLVPFADLIEMLRTNPICCSVVEFNEIGRASCRERG